MQTTLYSMTAIILALLAVDAVCFLMWALSGQHPVDQFYFGSITAHIIKLFI